MFSFYHEAVNLYGKQMQNSQMFTASLTISTPFFREAGSFGAPCLKKLLLTPPCALRVAFCQWLLGAILNLGQLIHKNKQG